ncbi:MAG: phenylalanine--tRNA ligase beta subunit [Pseudomonadota bacterium]|jgi:phenylalanyl-tRNA synthetase beta chain
MKFSESWLRQFVNPDLSSEALAELLTMAGLEVEERGPVAPPFNNVVVGHVLSVTKHPDADRLNVCEVDVGEGAPRQIVCGASNVAAGLKVPCALPGAELPGDFKIKDAKVRGVPSAGMLCAAVELGMAKESDGLMILAADAKPGTSLREFLGLDDICIELKLTPNRPDCLGLLGLAREVAALTNTPVTIPEIKPVAPKHQQTLSVSIEAEDLCGRFTGRVIKGVNARAKTPAWMTQALERCGLRSISALVDISNYVMLELNRPNHVFDLNSVKHGLTVRWAKPEEKLTLLGGNEVTLDPRYGVIADADGAIGLAGIMGGERTACADSTTDVFIEAAYWLPSAIQGRSRWLTLNTDAGHRFERGVDFADTVIGVERITQLILDICGGDAGPVVDQVTALPERKPVTARFDRIRKVLGIAPSDADIKAIFERLGFQPKVVDGGVVIMPPSWRHDLEIEEDLIEEVARVIGYDHVPARPPVGPMAMQAQTETQRPVHALRETLVERGYQEVINLAFTPESWEKDFAANATPVELANPIASHLSVMRSTLIGGLINTLIHNQRRRQPRLQIFETGRVFERATRQAPGQVEGYRQTLRLGGLSWGSVIPEQWGVKHRAVDFFDVKADVEALNTVGRLAFEATAHPAFHPGRSARVLRDGHPAGWLGELHPRWVQQYELESAPILFELDMDVLTPSRVPTYIPVSSFPVVLRDLAVVVDAAVPVQQLINCLWQGAPVVLRAVDLFDQYQGKGVPDGSKGLAFRFTLQDTQGTLEDQRVDAVMAQLLERLTAAGASLRT